MNRFYSEVMTRKRELWISLGIITSVLVVTIIVVPTTIILTKKDSRTTAMTSTMEIQTTETEDISTKSMQNQLFSNQSMGVFLDILEILSTTTTTTGMITTTTREIEMIETTTITETSPGISMIKYS